MANTLDYLRDLREQKRTEAGIPQMESEISGLESEVASDVENLPYKVESFRSELGSSQAAKDYDKQLAEGTNELWKHYYRLKQDTFNPESPNYIFANPVSVENLTYGALAPERTELQRIGLSRERLHEENREFLQNFGNILSQVIEGKRLKLSSKQSAYARALNDVAEALDLEFKIFESNQKAASAGGKKNTRYDEYDPETLAKADAVISEMKKDGKSVGEIKAKLESYGLNSSLWDDVLTGYTPTPAAQGGGGTEAGGGNIFTNIGSEVSRGYRGEGEASRWNIPVQVGAAARLFSDWWADQRTKAEEERKRQQERFQIKA